MFQKRSMTDKNLAAHRANARLSRGPATARGKEYIRAANLRHGFYSTQGDTALRALGEDPGELEALRQAVREQWRPANGFEDVLIMNLESALWRTRRAARWQEQYALHQAKRVLAGRQERLAAERVRLTLGLETLRALQPAVAGEHYVASDGDRAALARVHALGSLGELAELALQLGRDLGPPEPDPAVVALAEEIERERRQRRETIELYSSVPGLRERVDRERKAQGLRPVEEILAAEDAPEEREPGPEWDLSPEEWAGREPGRRALEQILAQGVGRCEARLEANARESASDPTPDEMAGALEPTSATRLVLRMEDSSFRQAWRITNLLIKLRTLEGEEGSVDDYAGDPGAEAGPPPGGAPGFEPPAPHEPAAQDEGRSAGCSAQHPVEARANRRAAPWIAVAAATAFLPRFILCRVNCGEKAVAAATALQSGLPARGCYSIGSKMQGYPDKLFKISESGCARLPSAGVRRGLAPQRRLTATTGRNPLTRSPLHLSPLSAGRGKRRGELG